MVLKLYLIMNGWDHNIFTIVHGFDYMFYMPQLATGAMPVVDAVALRSVG